MKTRTAALRSTMSRPSLNTVKEGEVTNRAGNYGGTAPLDLIFEDFVYFLTN